MVWDVVCRLARVFPPRDWVGKGPEVGKTSINVTETLGGFIVKLNLPKVR